MVKVGYSSGVRYTHSYDNICEHSKCAHPRFGWLGTCKIVHVGNTPILLKCRHNALGHDLSRTELILRGQPADMVLL